MILLVPIFQPIRFKNEINRDLVTRVFPRFRQFACFYLEFSLAPRDIFLPMIGYCDCFVLLFYKLNRKAPHGTGCFDFTSRRFVLAHWEGSCHLLKQPKTNLKTNHNLANCAF